MTEVVTAAAATVLQTTAARAAGDAAEAALEFEAMFLSQTVNEMLKTMPEGLMGGGHAEEMWRSVIARAIAEEIAGDGSTGLARSVESAIAGYASGTGENGE